jgi:hypothetical protein
MVTRSMRLKSLDDLEKLCEGGLKLARKKFKPADELPSIWS